MVAQFMGFPVLVTVVIRQDKSMRVVVLMPFHARVHVRRAGHQTGLAFRTTSNLASLQMEHWDAKALHPYPASIHLGAATRSPPNTTKKPMQMRARCGLCQCP